MRNVTITLDEDVAKWARVRAAELDTSVSRMLGGVLRQMMTEDLGYDAARERYRARSPQVLSEPGAGAAYPSRDELHDRDLR